MASTNLPNDEGKNGEMKAGRKKTTERTAYAFGQNIWLCDDRFIEESTITYNDFLVDGMLATGTVVDKERGQAHDNDSTTPLHNASGQLQGTSKVCGEEYHCVQ